MKQEIPLSKSYRLLYPRPVVLVSCIDPENGRPNLITVAWAVPLSISPLMVGILVAPKRHSHELIKKSGEFVINVPDMALLEKTVKCGKVSGKTHDKFKEFGLTALDGLKVKSPAIRECMAHLECKLADSITVGDHTLFVGEVVAAYADEKAFDGNFINLEVLKPIFQVGGNLFTTVDENRKEVE
ncbi:MAG: flavin reductase family protein [Candidatus Hadarchaeales archaeon]